MYKKSDIPTLIKNARIKKGLSQSELAEKLYISKQSISKYENGKALPSKDIRDKIEKELDINIDSIFEDSGIVLSKRTSYVMIAGALIGIIAIIALSISLVTVQSNLSNLKEDYDYLDTIHGNLQSDFASLQADYDLLNTENNNLLSEYNDLSSVYTSLNDNYYTLVGEHNTLSDEYDTLNEHYQSAINTNILDYAGIDIIFTSTYTIHNDNQIEFELQYKNLTSGSFTAESDLVTLKIKDSTSAEPYQTDITNNYSVSMNPNSTFTRTVVSRALPTIIFEDIEWFEIYYGGMLVAHIVPTE